MSSIGKALFACLLVIACASPVRAQTIAANLFAGAGAFLCCGGAADAWQMGLGADFPVTPRFSVGGDFGVVGSSGGNRVSGSSRFFSIDGLYHVGSRQSAAPFFVSGGLGVVTSRDVATGGLFFGGGFDWWARPRRGLRIELRDQLFEEYGTTHLVTVRAAWMFR